MAKETERPKADLRKNLRSPLIIQKVHLNDERKAFFGYTKNISRSGMFIATTNPINPGDQIELEFSLPAPLQGTVRCLCEVVWKRPLGSHLPFEPGIGLKFLDLDEDVSARIDDWIREQAQE